MVASGSTKMKRLISLDITINSVRAIFGIAVPSRAAASRGQREWGDREGIHASVMGVSVSLNSRVPITLLAARNVITTCSQSFMWKMRIFVLKE